MSLPSIERGLRRLFLVLCFTSCAAPPCRADDDAAARALPKGKLLLIGGSERDDNHLMWDELVRLAGGKGARVAVFPTADLHPERSGAAVSEHLRSLGLDPFVVPAFAVAGKDAYRKVVGDPAWVERVREAQAVYLSSGSQMRYRHVLVDERGQDTPLLEAIRDVYRRGGFIIGTSAGASVLSRVMYINADHVLPILLHGARPGKELDDGFGLVPHDWFIDQHCLVRGRFARDLVAMQAHDIPFGLGIDEDTAVVIENGRTARVIGYRGAVVVDLSKATHERHAGRFNLQKARLSFLSHGDQIDLATREVRVAPEKPPEDKIDPRHPGFKPYYEKRIFVNDILGNTALVDLMYKLVDSPHDEAIGLAFDGFAARAGDTPGFEFRFYRGKDTVSWDTHHARGDTHTVLNVYLDVRPITIRGPLYDVGGEKN